MFQITPPNIDIFLKKNLSRMFELILHVDSVCSRDENKKKV